MEVLQTGSIADPSLPLETEEWDEDEDYDDEDDEDIDAEALEIARKLGEQLWADISKASASNGETQSHPTSAPLQNLGLAEESSITPDIPTTLPAVKGGEAAIATIKAILTILEHDVVARSTLASTVVPGVANSNVFGLLQQSAVSGIIEKGIIIPLSKTLVTLARSDHLFASLRLSNASSIQLDKGKRKRDELDDSAYLDDRAPKRPYLPDHDLQTQVVEAVRIITQAFSAASTPTLDPATVSSIRLQLHQAFLFAVTSSAGGGPGMHALQEISGLIQVIGVLSGIQIGQPPETTQNPSPFQPSPQNSYPWIPGQSPTSAHDIGTAVYPCLIPSCKKVFARLYSLRAHQRSHAVHRPFRCNLCPASFARNHDLKRHIKLHDRKAWKCGACQKVFSRRDAFKRHKNGSRARGSKGEDCTDADVIEVELDDEEGGDVLREERRAKLWNGLALNHGNSSSSQSAFRERVIMEEGEIQENVILAAQGSVLSIHGLLQAHVGSALGMPVGQPIQAIPGAIDPTGGQATLASVIARAQSQNLPSALPENHSAVDQGVILPTGLATVPVPPNENASVSDLHQDSAAITLPSLSMYGLSDEQTKLLELAIANAASAAQAQAEAEAALEEEDDEDYDQGDEEYDESEGDDPVPAPSV